MRISSGNGSSSIGRRRGASRKRDAGLILNQKSILVLGMLECFCFVVCCMFIVGTNEIYCIYIPIT